MRVHHYLHFGASKLKRGAIRIRRGIYKASSSVVLPAVNRSIPPVYYASSVCVRLLFAVQAARACTFSSAQVVGLKKAPHNARVSPRRDSSASHSRKRTLKEDDYRRSLVRARPACMIRCNVGKLLHGVQRRLPHPRILALRHPSRVINPFLSAMLIFSRLRARDIARKIPRAMLPIERAQQTV